MPVHDFTADFTPSAPAAYADLPPGLAEAPGVRQLAHVEDGRRPLDAMDLPRPDAAVEEFVQPAFRALDDAMKMYWSGVRVPTKDSYRLMRVKVSGGDKSLLIWADELKEGTVHLPLAAIDRTAHDYNEQKYSPPIHAMTARYLSRRGDRLARVFRPAPFLVQYTLIIWAEHKRDAGYILQQVLPRFHPLAEFRMFDGKLVGNVQLRYGGCVDASDKEAGADQQASVRYEVSMTAEAWLALPEQVVPTILGQMTVMRESSGTILGATRGDFKPRWFGPR